MIVFQNDKAVGRLVSPRVEVSALGGAGSEDLLDLLTLVYDFWQPVLPSERKLASQQQQLHVLVDSKYKAAHFRLQVLGKAGGSVFALPFEFTFSGSDTAASISQHLQRIEYIRAQHNRFSESVATAPSSATASAVATPSARAVNGHPLPWSQQQYTLEHGEVNIVAKTGGNVLFSTVSNENWLHLNWAT